MARGTQLQQLLVQLRSELKESTNPAHTVNTDESYKYQLNAAQEDLYHEYAWTYLNGSFDVDTEAGERYYDWPVDYGSLTKVEFKWGNSWCPLDWGIAGRELSAQDSDEDERSDPVQKIRVKDGDQFEVFPIPATGGNPIRFWGRQALTRMVAMDDRAIIDDRLIVLKAAVSLAPKEQFQRRLTIFNTAFRSQKRRYGGKSRAFVLGGGQSTGRMPPGPVRVAEADRSGN